MRAARPVEGRGRSGVGRGSVHGFTCDCPWHVGRVGCCNPGVRRAGAAAPLRKARFEHTIPHPLEPPGRTTPAPHPAMTDDSATSPGAVTQWLPNSGRSDKRGLDQCFPWFMRSSTGWPAGPEPRDDWPHPAAQRDGSRGVLPAGRSTAGRLAEPGPVPRPGRQHDAPNRRAPRPAALCTAQRSRRP